MNKTLSIILISTSVAIPVVILIAVLGAYNKKFYIRKNRAKLNSIQY